MPQSQKIFKITLTPLGPFFFGGENVFGADGAQSDRRRSYLVESNILPQQTTLLGMLRYQLLAQNGLLLDAQSNAKQEQDAIDLVGKRSFSATDALGYGLIQGLSPLFLSDDAGNIWQPAPLDDQQIADTAGVMQPLCFRLDTGYPVLDNLNPKVGLSLQFGNAAGERKAMDDFFSAVSQVGITMTNRVKHRDLKEEDRKEGYYYQTYRSNTQSAFTPPKSEQSVGGPYRFIFYLATDASIAQYQLKDALVQMGGERSVFSMQVEGIEQASSLAEVLLPNMQYQYNQLDNAYGQIQRIVLQSDAYADWHTLRSNSLFVVGQPVPFRYFTSVLGKTLQFNDLKKDDATARGQSKPHTLLQRGSVLYVDDAQKLKNITDHLEAQTAFRAIGYNYFQTI